MQQDKATYVFVEPTTTQSIHPSAIGAEQFHFPILPGDQVYPSYKTQELV